MSRIFTRAFVLAALSLALDGTALAGIGFGNPKPGQTTSPTPRPTVSGPRLGGGPCGPR